MAHRILQKYPRTVLHRVNKEIVQKFNYLLVMDFEATCDEQAKLQPQEIIEFPCMALSTQDWQVKNVFHEYVKPKIHPTLTPFCLNLTGIIQQTVDNHPHFPEVFSKFCAWLEEGEYFKTENKSAFITCGNWDLRVMLPAQCALDNIELPEQFKQWIDVKYSFCDATKYYPRNLKDMLNRLNLPLVGHLHSGIHDTRNIVNIICALKDQHNAMFEITSNRDMGGITSSTTNS